VKAAAQPEVLTVKRIAVVDENGTERVVIAAPLSDPIIQGKRVKRDGAASGILIFDPKGMNAADMSHPIPEIWERS
jgi:hypothetical protein